MILRMLYNDQLAQASYLVGCPESGEALIVDPNRHVEQYLELAERLGLRITAVTETHIHADFVSGSRELAEVTGARLYLSDEGPSEWKYPYAAEAGAVLVREGDAFELGSVRVEVMHTPGHTPEHISFIVTDKARGGEPLGAFTGDFLFVGDVGRPDLLEKAAGITGTMEQGARQLFDSIQRFRTLPDHLQIWPAHGAGSACGRALGGVPQSTLGYEKLYNWAFSTQDPEEFIRRVLEGQPDPPRYFAQMKRVNKEGPAIASKLPAPAPLAYGDIEVMLRQGLVVDTRPADVYSQGFIPGTINIPLGASFLTWAGWLLPYDRPIALVIDREKLEHATQLLRLIGLDNLRGYWTPAVIDRWAGEGRKLATYRRLTPEEAGQLLGDGVCVVDVRWDSEREKGYVPGSIHLPLGYLEEHLEEIPTDKPLLVYCASGTRSAIASSILAGRTRAPVMDIKGGFDAWKATGNPVEEPKSTTTV